MQQKQTFSVVTAVGKNLKKECNKIKLFPVAIVVGRNLNKECNKKSDNLKLFPVAIAVGRNLSHLSPAPVMIIASSLETAAKTLGWYKKVNLAPGFYQLPAFADRQACGKEEFQPFLQNQYSMFQCIGGSDNN